MEAYQAVILAVVALLVGALLPVLFQLVVTLRVVRAAAEQAAPALASITTVAERLERLTAKVEEKGRVDEVLAAVDSLTGTVVKLRETATLASTLGAAVVPAVVAAVQAWRASDEGAGPASGEDAAPPASVARVAP